MHPTHTPHLIPPTTTAFQATPIRLRLLAVFWLLTLCVMPMPHAALPEGISGMWFEPERPGHGLSITQFSPSKAVLLWQTYDPEGRPMHLYAEADIDADGLRGSAFTPSGLGFAARDGGALQLPAWGELSLQFSSCDRATLRWQAQDPAYADGEVALQRLVRTQGLACQISLPGRLRSGAYQAYADHQDAVGQEILTYWLGAVDREGRLWAYEADNGDRLRPQSQGERLANTGSRLQMLVAEPAAQGSESGALELHAEVRLQSAKVPAVALLEVTRSERLDPSNPARFVLQFSNPQFGRQSWSRFAHTVYLDPHLDYAAIAGAYEVRTTDNRVLGFPFDHSLRVGEDGSLCADASSDGGTTCRFSGQLRSDPEDPAFFDFALRDQPVSNGPHYRGRAFQLRRGNDRALVFIGRDDVYGIAWVAAPAAVRSP